MLGGVILYSLSYLHLPAMSYTDRLNPNHPCICWATDPSFLTFLLLSPYPWDAPVMISIHTFSPKISSIYVNDKPATHS